MTQVVSGLRFVVELEAGLTSGVTAFVPLLALPGVQLEDLVVLVDGDARRVREGVVVHIGQRDARLQLVPPAPVPDS